jgi:hypothetical protein
MSWSPETGRVMVFYQGENHQIDAWNWENSGGWTWGEHSGHPAAPGTSPTMSYSPGSGRVMVVYKGENSQIDTWNWENSGGWTWGEHSGHPAG